MAKYHIMTMPIWISELQAFSIPTIAVGTICVAIQQYRIAKQKLRFDLYGRRFAIYEAFHDGVVTALNQCFERTFDEATRDLGVRLREARFLFDAIKFEYLNRLETDILGYRNSHLTIKGGLQDWNEEEAASYRSEHYKMSKRLLDSLQKLPSTLHSNMSVDDRLSFSVKPSSETSKLIGSAVS